MGQDKASTLQPDAYYGEVEVGMACVCVAVHIVPVTPRLKPWAAQTALPPIPPIANRCRNPTLFTITNKLFSITNKLFTITDRLFTATNNLFSITNELFNRTNRLSGVSNGLLKPSARVYKIAYVLSGAARPMGKETTGIGLSVILRQCQ